jgi:hypothetical protein
VGQIRVPGGKAQVRVVPSKLQDEVRVRGAPLAALAWGQGDAKCPTQPVEQQAACSDKHRCDIELSAAVTTQVRNELENTRGQIGHVGTRAQQKRLRKGHLPGLRAACKMSLPTPPPCVGGAAVVRCAYGSAHGPSPSNEAG